LMVEGNGARGVQPFLRNWGDLGIFPAINCRAILRHPFGMMGVWNNSAALADSGGEIAARFPLPKTGLLALFCGDYMPSRIRGGNIEFAPFFLKTNPMKPFVRSLLVSTLSAGATISAARGAEAMYENPVIPGDHPDPSIIRVGRD